MKSRQFFVLSALALAAILTACGGGGSSGSTTPVIPGVPTVFKANCADLTIKTSTISQADAQSQCVTPPSPLVNSSIVTAVPAATYPAGSEELAAFDLLNAERANCGYGLLTQNDKLDVSSKGHANWLLVNNQAGHYQVAGTPMFTGVTPQDRQVAAGYSASFEGSEVTAKIGALSKVGQGVLMVRNLLNAPYHGVAMTRGYRDTGVSVRELADNGITPSNLTVVNIDFGYKYANGMQSPTTGTLRTYPCEGSKGVNRFLAEETPSPVPGRNLGASPLGTSIVIAGDVGTTLTISGATMVNVATNAAVTMRAPVTSKNDAYGSTYLLTNEGYVSADASLDPMTAYKVTVTGTNNSSAFSRTFMFTTGSGNQR